jgi:hypothetical protein
VSANDAASDETPQAPWFDVFLSQVPCIDGVPDRAQMHGLGRPIIDVVCPTCNRRVAWIDEHPLSGVSFVAWHYTTHFPRDEAEHFAPALLAVGIRRVAHRSVGDDERLPVYCNRCGSHYTISGFALRTAIDRRHGQSRDRTTRLPAEGPGKVHLRPSDRG